MDIKQFFEPNKDEWLVLTERPSSDKSEIQNIVKGILADVKANGHAAVVKYNAQFGGSSDSNIRVSEQEFAEAESMISNELKSAIQIAKNNIEKFHQAQTYKEPMVEIADGIRCWRKSIAIEKVGLYVPGGSAPLFSTLLMLGIPALTAGCKKIVVCSPSDKNGKLHPAILYTAGILGLKNVYKTGGVQAIAAMAYGTSEISSVYKIFGPGNQYVTAAKQLVNAEGIAIDMPAGPSEVAVYADETSDASFVASDLLSQAEHGPDSQVILVCNSRDKAVQVVKKLSIQMEKLSRKTIVEQSLLKSRIIIIKEIAKAFDFLNEYAPEHLIISSDHAELLAERVSSAGSVFLGKYSPESAGDYASGTNHTLPTNSFARSYSGVSVDSFVKKITFQHLTRAGLGVIGKTVEVMAEAEGLDAHKNAVSIRLNSNK